MPESANPATANKITLPAIPALWLQGGKAYMLSDEGELKTLDRLTAQRDILGQPVLVCHAPYTAKKLGPDPLKAYDVLELFAFVHPAVFAVPTPAGLAKTLGLDIPRSPEDTPLTLIEITRALLSDLQKDIWQAKANPIEIAAIMGQNGAGWVWTPFIFQALGQEYDPRAAIDSRSALNIWKNLPEWSEEAPPAPPSHFPITGDEARTRLNELLGSGAEKRQEQIDYTTALTSAFAPAEEDSSPCSILAEAGTGVGKTLGYLAPASLWAEKNQASVWISTYTKNLQRQIDQELNRLYPNPQIKESKSAVRKGRENYLCLLNFEDTANGAALARIQRQPIAAGIMARWIAATKDGDLSGGDFPGWLASLLGYHFSHGLSDRRGECLYSACDHYHRCFVERAARKSNHADLVVANHALVMIQTALSADGKDLPRRYIFDEGHHLFDAADSAFSAHLTARETYDLRRWLRGNEGGQKSRSRGLKRRCEDLAAGLPEAETALSDILSAATCLTGDGWIKRMKDSAPKGPTELFIAAVYQQVYARTANDNGPYTLETETYPISDDLLKTASILKKDLIALQKPMLKLAACLSKKLNDQADTLESDTRKRLESVAQSLERRARLSVSAWIDMLEELETISNQNNNNPMTNPDLVSWMAIERVEGKTFDIGLYRHHIDPMVPFSQSITPHAHGIAVTSATLRDKNDDQSWDMAVQRSGLIEPKQSSFASPFAYDKQTKILVISDVNKNNIDQLASAYRVLFKAAGGGGLGLFTAISRLAGVYHRLLTPMEKLNLPLYGQHMDEIDIGTLVDIFREQENSCLLGTDAVRDGVDVPGRSLRLIVFDRVPWPRPTILHKARREAFGGRSYDEMMTRLKLKQAYGRLIRRSDDKGVFVMLDSALPSRLENAFPESVEVERIGLKEACRTIKDFL